LSHQRCIFAGQLILQGLGPGGDNNAVRTTQGRRKISQTLTNSGPRLDQQTRIGFGQCQIDRLSHLQLRLTRFIDTKLPGDGAIFGQ